MQRSKRQSSIGSSISTEGSSETSGRVQFTHGLRDDGGESSTLERDEMEQLAADGRCSRFRRPTITAAQRRRKLVRSFDFEGSTLRAGEADRWKTNAAGMDRLDQSGSTHRAIGNTLRYVAISSMTSRSCH